jgi:hypothetical protein
VIAFNSAEGWSRDVTADIANKVCRGLWVHDLDIPPALRRFHSAKRHSQAVPVAATIARRGLNPAMPRKPLELPPYVARAFVHLTGRRPVNKSPPMSEMTELIVFLMSQITAFASMLFWAELRSRSLEFESS